MNKILRLIWNAGNPVLLYEILLTAAAVLGGQLLYPASVNHSLLLTGAAAVPAIIIAFSLYQRERGDSQEGRVKRRLKDWLLLCLFGSGYGLVSNAMINWTGISTPAFRETQDLLFSPDIRLQVVLIGFLIPAAEELIFRGLCFLRLRREMGFWSASLLSALLFGWFHGNIIQGVFAFFGGLFMAWGYECYHSLIAPWVIHTSYNLLSLAMSSGTISRNLAESTRLQAAFALVGAVLMLTGLFQISWRKERE